MSSSSVDPAKTAIPEAPIGVDGLTTAEGETQSEPALPVENSTASAAEPGTPDCPEAGDAPNVAEKVCGALYFLAQGYEDAAVSSSPLSPFFHSIVQSLLAAAHREDAVDSRLRVSAYETLNEVVRCSTEETAPIVMQLVPVILMKLNETLETPKLSSEDGEKQSELQSLLCGCLQVIIQKLGASQSTKYGIVQYSDQMMNIFLRIFSCRSAMVHEEAMLAIGALAYAIGVEFGKYMQEFYRYLEMGLQNFEEYQVCAITVGVVGDICRVLDDKMLPFCDGIMSQLLSVMASCHSFSRVCQLINSIVQ